MAMTVAALVTAACSAVLAAIAVRGLVLHARHDDYRFGQVRRRLRQDTPGDGHDDR